MLKKIFAYTERLLFKFRLPFSIWLFERKITLINQIDRRTGNLSISRGVYASLLFLGFFTVISMDGNRWFDKNLIDPIESLFASSIEEEYYLGSLNAVTGESYSFNNLTTQETISIRSQSTSEVYSGVETSSWKPSKSEKVTLWGTNMVDENGLIFAPFAILLRVILVLIFSLTWIPFWNIIDFILRMSGKSENERRDYWKGANRVDGIILFILLFSLGIVHVPQASNALDTILGLWQKVLTFPANALALLLFVNVLTWLIIFLKTFDIQGINANQIVSRIVALLTQKRIQYVIVVCLFVCEFLPWWTATATGSASDFGLSSSSSASISGIEIFPGWLSLLAIIATTVGIKNSASWAKWAALGSSLTCMLTMTIGSSSTSLSYGEASASASTGPDYGFVLFLVISLVLFISMMLKSRFVQD